MDATKQRVTVYDPNGVRLAMTLHTDPNYSPSGVQVDSQGNVWVANRTNNNITIGEIQIFHKNGTIDAFTQDLVYPLGIVFQAGTGDAWVGNSETPNDALTTYSPTGAFLHQIPTSGFTPTYLAFAKNGHLYATDGLHSLVKIFKPSGHQIGSTITQGLNLPYGIAFDSIGNFYVANVGFGGPYNGSTITKYNSSGTLICTIKKRSGCH